MTAYESGLLTSSMILVIKKNDQTQTVVLMSQLPALWLMITNLPT
ncbi:hypothetical protein [Endozoicomonas elysicola]|nr:hypothetical protein [Endozoicomonas elysicola]